ncbi:hypothetical protein FWH58_03075 [Candidatus Saccharibacteria bacterium]|nr:hypothetical protein [Candidatus Saccharibacteria bacterium]
MVHQPKDSVILETTDLYDSIVRFNKNNYNKHEGKHPELRQKQFCPGQIIMALKTPSFVIKGRNPDTLCYYFELFRVRDVIKLVKVVVLETNRHSPNDPHCVIKTAFKTDHVQELKYGYEPMCYNNYKLSRRMYG